MGNSDRLDYLGANKHLPLSYTCQNVAPPAEFANGQVTHDATSANQQVEDNKSHARRRISPTWLNVLMGGSINARFAGMWLWQDYIIVFMESLETYEYMLSRRQHELRIEGL